MNDAKKDKAKGRQRIRKESTLDEIAHLYLYDPTMYTATQKRRNIFMFFFNYKITANICLPKISAENKQS